ncbi:unnamed protein product [Victoria cruziana]
MAQLQGAVAEMNISEVKKNRIQVSNTKKPLFFYVNLAKRYMRQYNQVELSALGMVVYHLRFTCASLPVLLHFSAIATVVTIAEILKNSGPAVEKKIQTSTIDMKDESKGRHVQKAKIEILLGKMDFDNMITLNAEQNESATEIIASEANED